MTMGSTVVTAAPRASGRTPSSASDHASERVRRGSRSPTAMGRRWPTTSRTMPPRPDRPTRATLATLGSPPGPGPHRIRARPTPKRSAGKPARITQDTIATGVTAGPVHFGTGTTTCSDTEAASARTDRPRSPLTGDTTPIGRDLGPGEPPRGRLVTRAFAPSFVGFRREWIRSDVLAGLTVWAVLVPESLAYATIAGVPPVVGLYAAVPALVLYAVLGSSRHLVVASMSATAALSAGIVGDLAQGGGDRYMAMTAALAIITRLLRLAAGLARMGFLASFISEPVLKGFIVGLALTIMVGQLPKLFGIEKGEGDFFAQLWHFVTDVGDADLLSTAVGLGTLALVLCLRRWLPR